jgi:outer membrane protein assembly factor BamA
VISLALLLTQLLFGDLRLVTNDSLPAGVHSLAKPSGAYSAQAFEAYTTALMSRLEDQGYWYAELSVIRADVDSSNHRIHIDLAVTLNGLVRVDWIRFEGSSPLTESYLLRAIGFRSGSPATRAELERLRGRLSALEDLDAVSEPRLISESGRDGLQFDVVPSTRHRSDVLIGYADKEVIGQVSLHVRHLVLEGSRLDVRFHRVKAYQNRMDLSIGAGPASAGFHLYQQDSTFFTRALRLAGDLRATDDLRFGLWIEQQTTVLGVPVSGSDLEEGTRRMTGVRAIWQSFSGSRASLSAGAGRLNGRSVTTTNADWALLWRPARRFHAAILGEAAVMISDRIPIDQQYRFGGATSFRGYREDEIQVPGFAWNELEARFRLDSSAYAFGFVGAASTSDSALLGNAGLGFSTPTRLGPLRFTYAASSQRGWLQGVVHVSLSNGE